MNNRHNLTRAAMMLLLAALTTTMVWAQSSVVYIPSKNGSTPTGSTAYDLPTSPNCGYSMSQQMYTKTEIGKSGKITSIGFYNEAPSCSRDVDIYLTSTTKESFSSTYDWVAVKATDKVFSGTIILAHDKWTVIDLDTPFEYDGTKNLIVTFDDNTDNNGAQYNSSCSGFSADTQQAVVIYNIAPTLNDPVNFDPMNPPTEDIVVIVDGKERTLQAKFPQYKRKNQILFGFETYPRPYYLTVDNITDKSAQIQCTLRGGATAWNLRYHEVGASEWTTLNGLATSSKSIEGLTAATQYEVQVQGIFAGNKQSDWTVSAPFVTMSSGEVTTIDYEFTDRNGNGWGDQAIRIVEKETGFETAYLTMLRGKKLEGTVTLSCGKEYDVQWVSRYPDDYAGYSECGFRFSYGNGDEILSRTTEDYQELRESHTLETFTADGTEYDYKMPTSVEAYDETYQGATLKWKSKDAQKWQVSISTDPNAKPEIGNLLITSTNPFVFEGLASETDHYVAMRAVETQGSGSEVTVSKQSRWTKKQKFKTKRAKERARKLRRAKIKARNKAKAELEKYVGTEKRDNLLYSQLSSKRSSVDMDIVVLRKLKGDSYLGKGTTGITSQGEGSFDNVILIPAKKGSQLVMKTMQKTGLEKKEPYSTGWIPKKELSGDPANEEEVTNNALLEAFNKSKRYQVEAYSTTNEEADVVEATDDYEQQTSQARLLNRTRGAEDDEGYLWIRHNNTDGFLYLMNLEIVEPANVEPWTIVPLAEGVMDYLIEGLTPETTYLTKVEPVYDDNTTGLSSPITAFTPRDAIYLQDDEDNSTTLAENKNQTDAVVLEGRTFYLDGRWNTLCVPFNISEDEIEGSPLENMIIMKMHDAVMEGSTLKVTFWQVNSIQAGKAYIFQYKYWDGNIHSPYFPSVTISSTAPTKYTDVNDMMNFVGTYSPYALTANDQTQLYLKNDQLWYPSAAINVNAFRGFFELKAPLTAREFVLNFEDGTTAIINPDVIDSQQPTDSSIYTLDGRKLTKRPSQKGVYLMNGKKVVIK